MKKYAVEFIKRGLMSASGGPVILAIVYGILGASGEVASLTTSEVCLGVLTVTLMAFLIGGISVVYQTEHLPLMSAILIHCAVLYAVYILVYLLNGWLKYQLIPVLIFTGVFFTGYALIWLCIYFSIKAKADSINRKLKNN